MIQIKKTILTLVALLAVTTGAWALDPNAVTAAEINSDLYSGWSSLDERLLKASDLPGFQAVTENQAKSWTGVPSTGRVILFYDFVADGNVKVVIFKNGVYDSSYEVEDLRCYDIYEDIKYDGETKFFYTTGPAPSAASGPEVAWDKATKTGTFTMPGGNVTLEPEYYPQATLAFQGLTAAEDAAAKTDAPLAVVADGAVTGGTLMYYVATDKNFSQADAIALAETQWSADIPTAETIEAAGTYIMWYYIKGDAEHSDTDPIPLAVTLLPEPTYAVTFAEGTPESDKWKASPNTGVTKGETVTVTYTGSKKVIGVKAEKKAAETSPVVGQIIGSDGKNYDANATLPDGVTAVAMIAYVGSETGVDGYTHGLALALTDEGGMNWTTATGASGAAAHTPAAPTTTSSWMLPSKDQWNKMIDAAGSYTALRDGFSGISGASNLQSAYYWSSTEDDSNNANAWLYRFSNGLWYSANKGSGGMKVRACIAF